MTRRLAPFLLVLLALALGAPFAGCGGGNDAQDVLKETFNKNREIRSGQLGIALGITSKGGGQSTSQPLSLRVTGPFETRGPNRPPRFDLVALISAAGQQRSMGAVSTGDKGYIRYGGTAYAVPPAVFSQFIKGFPQGVTTANGNKSVGGLGIDPSKWLTDPKLEGDQRIAGVETTHVSARIDIAKFVGDLSGLLQQATGSGQSQQSSAPMTAAQKRQLTESIKSATVDVWSGKDDKTLRKMAVVLELKSPSGQTSTAAGSGSLSFTLTFSDLNKAQRIVAPVNAGTYAQLQAKLKQLGAGQLGAASASTGAQSAGANRTSGTTAGQDTKAQAYTNCITKAGGDVEKAQQCADLLNR